ncbi:MAG: hypothetical protein OXG47_01995 [bacterium]|nr:hypothetical protein [bacterium]MCY3924051.1 hypothetical protein [bacterium]
MSPSAPRRNVTAVLLRPSSGDAWMLDEALGGLAGRHTVLAPPQSKRFGTQEACRLALVHDADLVLLVGGDVRLGYSDVARMLDTYEAGARVVVGDRRSLSGRVLRPLAGLTLGVWRKDMGSPVRLYDAAALAEIISHVPPDSPHPALLMSMVEHRLRFSVREILLRNASETPKQEDPATALAEMLAGLTELWSFRTAARAIG